MGDDELITKGLQADVDDRPVGAILCTGDLNQLLDQKDRLVDLDQHV